MKFVKIGSPELSTGAKKSSQVCDLENRGFGQTIQKKCRKKLIFLFCGGLRGSAGVENIACGVGFLTSFRMGER